MLNALTIDVEDYYHVTAFEGVIERSSWTRRPPRVERNVALILDVLSAREMRGTFFVLGWVAERFPGLVLSIQERGHEIACHGYGHERLYRIGPARFRDDLRRARDILEEQCGKPVIGYRAPSFSITTDSLWAYDILAEEGFRYDSSVFPIRHDIYGLRSAPTAPHVLHRPAGALWEFPMSTVSIGCCGRRCRIPVAGGGYLRLLPLWFLKWAVARINTREHHPTVLYFHPWEVDPGQPRIRASLRSRLRHYTNLDSTLDKVGALLAAFHYAPMAEVLGLASEGAVPARLAGR